MICNRLLLASLLAIAGAVPASAGVVISGQPTQNMNCSAGVCAPTAGAHTILNNEDLENLLASGNIEIVTNYEGRRRYKDVHNIEVDKCIVWSTPSTLSLDASETIKIDNCVSVRGSGALSLSRVPIFAGRGKITFSNLSSNITVVNVSYTLENSLPGLATAIAADPQGAFALADSYDASQDGTYSESPISTNFLGNLEGLGNAISNISVNNTTACCVGGLFQSLSSSANVLSLRLANLNVVSTEGAAGLAYESFGHVENSSVTGIVTGGDTGDVGGMVGDNYGSVELSYSAVTTSTGTSVTDIRVGGLVAADLGGIDDSFAMGSISAGDGSGSIGGLVGEEALSSYQCYATGNVSGGAGLNIGGLIGFSDHDAYSGATYSYSAGGVTGGSGSIVGGLIGVNNSSNTEYDYWDTDTSGTTVGVGLGNASGVTGLTTAQLQSGLPTGFASTTWRENAKINNGLPYLIDNPPPK